MTDMERLAMEYLLRGDHPVLGVLRGQLTVAAVAGRHFSGVGFFTQFEVPAAAPRLSSPRRVVIRDVYAEVVGLQHPVGFILFVEAGVLDTLECFIHDAAWPEEARASRMYYVRPEQPEGGRLLETVERELSWALQHGRA